MSFAILSFAASLVSLSAFASLPAPASELCREWSAPESIGSLDVSLVSEASGLAVSRAFPGRIYLNNDSGDGPFFYVQETASKGGTRKVEIADFEPRDAEDLAYGPCGNGKTCLAIGDIGDNRRARSEIQVALVEERRDFPEKVRPLRVLRLRYPDGARNAESLLLHPNGDIFIVTKEEDPTSGRAGIARVYRLASREFAAAEAAPVALELAGEIDIPALAPGYSMWGQIATGASLATDGRRFLLLTYESAIEFAFDLAGAIPASAELRAGIDYRILPLQGLPQQETIAYLPGDDAFLYSTESVDGSEAPLMRARCLD